MQISPHSTDKMTPFHIQGISGNKQHIHIVNSSVGSYNSKI